MRHDPAVHPEPPARTVTLHLHAAARAVAGSGAVLALRGRAAGLVALALLEPGGVAREKAALMLWPDSPNPRQALRQQLLRFRQALGQALIVGEDMLQAAAGVVLEPAPAGEWLLADEPAGDDDFGRWLAARRQLQAQSRREPLQQALAAAEAAGELDAALAHARALLALDAADEAHHAALMRVHYLRGEPAAGLAAYERLAAQVAQRFGTRPAATTQALAAALRRAGSGGDQAAPATLALPLTLRRPPVLAGRARELAVAASALAEGLVLLVEGEAGIGKSRLLAEALAGAPGPVLQAAARPGDAGAPYASLARLLRPLLDPPPAGLSPRVGTALARLSGITAGPAAEALPPGAMQAAVGGLLTQAGIATVALDDLHFADAATLELLSGLAAAGTPQRWLLAQRPAEAPPAAQALHEGLQELQRLLLLPLPPLDEAAAAALIDSLAVPGLQGAALAQPLVRHGGGNPLFMLETLKQGLADGSLARGELPRPASVGALIERRLQRLGDSALTLARVAALAGPDFCIELAEAVTGQRAVQLASAWNELQAAQVMRDEAFAHDLVADAVRRGVPAVVTRRVHAAVADWLLQRGAPPARVAAQLWAAGQPGVAALHALAAAKLAYAQGRASETVDLLDRALSHPEWPDPAAQFDAARMRCEALWDVDLGPRLDAAAEQLLALAATPVERAQALAAQLHGLYFRGDFAAALAQADAAASAAEAASAHEALLQVRLTQARALARSGAVGQGLALARAAQPLLQGLPPACSFEFHGMLGVLLLQAARAPEARVELEAALALAPGLGRQLDVPNLLANRASCEQVLGLAQQAAAGQEAALREARAAGHQGVAVQFAEMNIAIALLDANRYAEAWPWIERCAAALQAQAPAYTPMAGTLQARWYLELGQHGRAARAFEAHPLAPEAPAFVRAYRAIVQAQVAAAAQQPQGVRTAVAEALAAARASGRPNLEWEAQLMAHGLGQAEGAGPLEALAAATQAQGFTAHAAVAQALRGNAAGAAALLDPASGLSPRWFYRGRVLAAVGGGELARRWLRSTAEEQVPPAFRESFLHRQPVNLALQRVLPSGAVP
jgi:DNA-binding SARP family transcriptional activator